MATTETADDSKPIPKTAQIDVVLITVLRWTRLGVAVVGLLTLVALCGGFDAIALPSQVHSSGQTRSQDHIALDIMPVKPGGPGQDYAAYVPSTVLTAPAHSIVTVTIRNFDLDAVPVPDDSPYTSVHGTIGGIAYADGQPYARLTRTGIAHTFTVPGLDLNVPIPGNVPGGKRYVIVTFSFRTGAAGLYSWRCFAPCGDEPDGEAGAMAEVGYMRGTLLVVR
ncbi:MAG TPA: hypothetical protein VF040_21120 [Ktedonobacterales bacterium]